ncbi:hypothetical protein L3C95_11575 [Chitinophaga filiformis]|uniref:hypothetical protein n=1 Tax=Chitinophaga filiformis TaxID=104663 RepID=UPI001F3F8166|nr:hypothetical protein [Chitinophaga filiformis]MCF6402563.1 hypothetical protein [Chitinophaga filiformis]MCF6403519.1 hypothetical protein [Chitinophaga filiformis]
MSNEKHSDSWIGELDALEALPGEAPFDKAVAWGRLHQRMDEKKTKKRVIWYWAAACLLLACVTLFFTRQEHQTQLTPPASYVENPYKKKADKDDADIKEVPVIAKRPAILVQEDTFAKKIPVAVKERKPTAIADVMAILPPIIKAIPHPDSILAETTAVAAAPKKMRVVHINDVGGDVIGNAYVYPEHKQFKISLSGPAGFASQIVADKNQKTTSSPKN